MSGVRERSSQREREMDIRRKGPSTGGTRGTPTNTKVPPEHTWKVPEFKSTFGRDFGTITGAAVGGFEGAIIGGTLGSLMDD